MARIEASIEGPIQFLGPDPTGTGVRLLAMGVTVEFVPGTLPSGRVKAIRTPAKTITPAELLSTAPFPGRTEAGFVSGTIIAEGEFETDPEAGTGLNILHANFIDVEPAESVLLGALTQNTTGNPPTLRINGSPVVMLTDPRMPANSDDPANPLYHNQYGFPMDISSAVVSPNGPTPIPPPAPTSAEGYFASGTFHAFLFEYGGTGTLLQDPAVIPQISMERAAYRDRGAQFEIEARGFATASHGAPNEDIELFRIDLDAAGNPVERSVSPADIDVVEPGFVRWRVRERTNKPAGLNNHPILIRVKNHRGVVPATGNPCFAELEPDVREA